MQPENVLITIEAIKGRDGRYYVDCGGQMMPVNDNHIQLIDHGHKPVSMPDMATPGVKTL